MRVKLLLKLLVLALIVSGLGLGLWGCNGGSSQPSSTTDPIAADTAEQPEEESADVSPEPEAIVPAVEEPIAEEAEPSDSEEIEPVAEPVVEELAEQLLFSWARDAGGLSHCDRLSIYADGGVEAVVCKASTAEATVYGNLTEGQLAQALAWAGEYAAFTRREMEMSSAVRTTTLHGTGGNVPALEAKVEMAAFAADIFLGLTEPE